MTRDILMNNIIKLDEKKIYVAGIVSDNCSSNISCWRELGAHDYTKPYFEHPITKKKNNVSPDTPHLLKLLRNWFIDHGSVFNGTIVTAQPLRDLVEGRLGAEITLLFKLNTGHLELSSQERQNVRRAAELLSRTTAVSLRRYMPKENELADIIEMVDLWFSVSNSFHPNAKLHYKRSYTASEDQLKALDDMFNFIANMVAVGKTNISFHFISFHLFNTISAIKANPAYYIKNLTQNTKNY